jgi:hypothetical protein
MSDSPPTDPEALARKFHEVYERLAPHYHYETRKASAVPWEDVPDNNKALMVAVAAEIQRDWVAEVESLRAEVDAYKALDKERLVTLRADVDALRSLETEVESLQAEWDRVGCMTPDGLLMRGHFGPCEQAGHRPIYVAVAGSATPTEENDDG